MIGLPVALGAVLLSPPPLAALAPAALAPAALAPAADVRAVADTIPDWRRSGVCYEVFVRSFHDSDGDGVGDLRGLIERLDHINDGDPATDRDLGATCIWLMPISPSPSYHGYDVTNYYAVNREYGTEADFRSLMAEAHRRGIRVIIDLVLNHASNEHPFFKSALLDRDSPFRDWFVWSPEPRPAPGWQAPVWHPVRDGEEYYYGLFWHGMPDFNLANPEVTAELKEVARYWLEDMGVDGFRLDAVRHFFEGPGGEWSHAEPIHEWLRDYAAHIRRVAPDAFTVGEVWDSTHVIVPYYPDQLDAYFIFEVADATVDAVRSGSGRGFLESVERAQRLLPTGRWSPFLRNHDQTRTMTELAGDVDRARLAATLLLTIPGFPFVYYGEEIGMTADKPDPRLRTPMHWALEPAAGFTTAVPWEPLQPDSFTANVAVQDEDPRSLLNHYRALIRLRAASPALWADAEFVPLASGSDGVVAYLRRGGGRTAVVVANLGGATVARPTLSSAAGVLPPGRYAARPLLGEAPGSALRVGRDGRLRGWAPLPALEPLAAVVLELSPNR